MSVLGFKITYRADLNTPPQLDAFKVEVPIRSKRKVDHIVDDCFPVSIVFLLLARIQFQSNTTVISTVSKSINKNSSGDYAGPFRYL